jgi:hypothetical protein
LLLMTALVGLLVGINDFFFFVFVLWLELNADLELHFTGGSLL